MSVKSHLILEWYPWKHYTPRSLKVTLVIRVTLGLSLVWSLTILLSLSRGRRPNFIMHTAPDWPFLYFAVALDPHSIHYLMDWSRLGDWLLFDWEKLWAILGTGHFFVSFFFYWTIKKIVSYPWEVLIKVARKVMSFWHKPNYYHYIPQKNLEWSINEI